MQHIVLLGDSIFDNASYVPVGKSVLQHFQTLLPEGSRVTLLAVDGDIVQSVFDQLEDLPADATHLALSVGGNDALHLAGQLFGKTVQTIGEALSAAYEFVADFRSDYESLFTRLAATQLPIAACTIYDNVPGLGHRELAGLALFNDVITRTALEHRANLIDLRILCRDTADYSEVSPIEPSHLGGLKIAKAIVDWSLR
jgi:hypothetical protein